MSNFISGTVNAVNTSIKYDDYTFGVQVNGATKLRNATTQGTITISGTLAANISASGGEMIALTSLKAQKGFLAGQAVGFIRAAINRCYQDADGKAVIVFNDNKISDFVCSETYSTVQGVLATSIFGGGSATPAQTAATTSAAGVGGKTTNPPQDSQNKFFKGDSTFGTAIPLWSSSVVYEVDDIVRGADDKIYRVTTAHTGGSFTSGNFTELSAGGGSSLTVTTVGTAIFQYEILTGTPVIGYTKTGGAGNGVMTCTGGTIKLRRFTDDILAADLASTAIRFDLVGTGTVAKLARPIPTKYLLNATDALADASTNASTSNQVDIDNTPPVKYGNIVTTGFGSMSVRLDNVTTDIGLDLQW